jgi:anti-anti-sigma factor
MGLSASFRVERERIGDVSVVSVFGEIDLATAEETAAALDLARPGARVLVLDLRGVRFMDSSGLHLAIEEQLRARDEGHRFAIVRGPEAVRRLFEIAGLPPTDPLFVDSPNELVAGDQR